MLDHTYKGTPVSRMTQADLDDCLGTGFKILDTCGYEEGSAKYWVRLRLEIEVVRRRLGIAVREV